VFHSLTHSYTSLSLISDMNTPHTPHPLHIRYRDEGLTPEIPEDCPEKLAQLMKMCWNKDPNQRPVSPLSLHSQSSQSPFSIFSNCVCVLICETQTHIQTLTCINSKWYTLMIYFILDSQFDDRVSKWYANYWNNKNSFLLLSFWIRSSLYSEECLREISFIVVIVVLYWFNKEKELTFVFFNNVSHCSFHGFSDFFSRVISYQFELLNFNISSNKSLRLCSVEIESCESETSKYIQLTFNESEKIADWCWISEPSLNSFSLWKFHNNLKKTLFKIKEKKKRERKRMEIYVKWNKKRENEEILTRQLFSVGGGSSPSAARRSFRCFFKFYSDVCIWTDTFCLRIE
jgi:hypothetical protein